MLYACASASWDVGGLGEFSEYHLLCHAAYSGELHYCSSLYCEPNANHMVLGVSGKVRHPKTEFLTKELGLWQADFP